MYHEDTDTPAVARTSNLNDELGQVFAALLACMHETSIETSTVTGSQSHFISDATGHL